MSTALVVEDHDRMRDWLSKVAAEAFPGAAVTAASTLEEARALVAERSFGLALVDISLPDGSGVALIGELAEDAKAETYSVVTTIYDDDQHLFTALEAGARGYLLKDQPRKRLVDQLQGIVRGEPPISPSVARRILRYFSRRPTPDVADAPQLTDREREVLDLLSRGFNRNDIAQALDISPHTAAGHVKAIYRKLNVSGRAEATLEAVQLGIIDSGR
ncbi:response regulator transcription factor [Ectothiorhodospiraceae bacterium WFHF3C12]|nr:response regulator transcription factor [Ectothiorhodospiraceae bacterium WFHF3C12]